MLSTGKRVLHSCRKRHAEDRLRNGGTTGLVAANCRGTPHGLCGTQAAHQVVVLQHPFHGEREGYSDCQRQAFWDRYHLQQSSVAPIAS